MELISKEVVKQIIDSGRTREQMIGMVECAVAFRRWKSSTESTDSSTESTDSSTDSSTVSLGVFEQVKWERDVALEQLEALGYCLGEKIRTDEDCISREAVHEAIIKWAGSMDILVVLPTRETRPLLEIIHELPPVKPKERTGEWIKDEEQNHVEKTWHCSECGNTAWGSYEKTTYCCQCGARMKKG